MTLADTTFTNLRGSLTRLTPLVNASKPFAPKLQQLLATLEPFAQEARSRPSTTWRRIISRPGPDNDLTELTALGQKLARARPSTRSSPTASSAPARSERRRPPFNDSTPELAVDRPYAVDLTGWFEGFSHPGGYDANGAYSRVAPIVGVASVDDGALNILPAFLQAGLRSVLAFGSNGSGGLVTTGQGDRFARARWSAVRSGTRTPAIRAVPTRCRPGK